jgi:two-component system CheB/CheR fusion protein
MEKREMPAVGEASHGGASADGKPVELDAVAQEIDPIPPSDQPTFVVGIGASAGGLEAIERFFRAMPVDSGMAFVVIQHLSPDFESLMDQLLARFTPMAVERVDAAVVPRRNTIYLLPPRKEMVVMAGQLRIYDKPAEQTLSMPINVFFRSLAREMSDRAIAIVLSGTGTDGSMGVMDVHGAGGLVLVQSEETAKFDGMPRSAVMTGHVDAVLAPESMPEALLSYAKNPTASLPQSVADKAVSDALRGVPVILHRLRETYGIDFNFYKPATTSRRIERRMAQGNFATVQEYCDTVVRDPGELDLLYKDLLIGVTRFFRDPEAFAIIAEKVVPAVLDQVPPDREIRIWCAGCATGEEPYSIAMLFLEAMDARHRDANIKIFASDVHRESLQFAAAGVYPETSLAEMTPERRDKFFERDAKGFRVAPRLRKVLIFSPHNLIKDPPFTRMDLVTCRNLLIYFQQPAQTKVLASFHFALSLGGFLFLGPSEGTGEVQGEFEVVERHWKIYRKSQESRLPVEMRVSLAPFATRPVGRAATPGDLRLARAYDVLLGRYVPSAVLVDERREVLHVFGDADQYLRPPSGRMQRDLVAMARGDLRIAISSAIQNALKRNEKVVFRGVRTGEGDHVAVLDIVADPILDKVSSSTYVLVLFEQEKAIPIDVTPGEGGRELTIGAEARERIHQLEVELRHAKESLQTTIEELETSNEELQASNEELLASNEELQSTNEELHSVNEELYSVNSEHEQKIKELAEVTTDLKNLMHATEIGTLFLDRDQRIRLFTPAAARLFNLLPQDEGRDIRHITSRIKDDDVFEDIATASAKRTRVDSHVLAPDGSVYLRRIMPYFDGENQPDGLVITFVDVSALARAEERLRALTAQLEARVEERTRELEQLNVALLEKARDLTESEERFRLIVEHAPEAILSIDGSGKIALANAQAERMFGYPAAELLGQDLEILVPDAVRASHGRLRDAYFASPSSRVMGNGRPLFGRRKDGSMVPVEIGLNSIRFQHEVHAMAFISDLTSRRLLEDEREHILRRMTETQKLESLGVLAGGIAHDFNNLLTGIAANASIAQSTVDDRSEDGGVRECLSAIQHSTRRAAELCHQLLAYSGRGKFVVQPTDLSGLVQDTAKLVHASISRRIDVRFDLTADLPPVSMDVTQIRQVIMNLLINGAEAIGDGTGELAVATGRMQVTADTLRQAILSEGVSEGLHVYLEVTDTGSGIKATDLKRIFEPFFTTKFTGRGLGLSATLGIVRGHKGTMIVRSVEGRGTTFRVALPPAEVRPAVTAVPMSREPSSFTGSGHVLVVDDDDLVRNIARRLLQRIGFQVTMATDGREGVDTFAADPTRYALVLLDLTMPRLSGAEAFAEMRRVHPGVKVLLMSGFTESEVQEAFGSEGPAGFLPKPFDVHSLTAAVRAALVGARAN